MARIAKALFAVLAYMVVFDIAGVAVCLLTEVLSVDFVVLSWTIWFVAGAFCGMLAYDSANKRLTTQGDEAYAARTGMVVIAMTLSLILVQSALFFKFMWKGRSASDPYVPDNMPLTILFFTTILASMILCLTVFRPTSNAK